MKEKKEIIYFRESLLQSIIADSITFGLLFGGIYLNHEILGDSEFLNWVLVIMILINIFSMSTPAKKFYNKKDLIKYLEKN